MDEAIRRAAKDRQSGAAEIASAVARALAGIANRPELRAASRLLLRAHPAMAPLWRMLSDALETSPHAASKRWIDRLAAESDGVAHAVRWAVARRSTIVTHSASSSVLAALRTVRSRVRAVVCTESRPGEEGARFARRLRRDGFDASVVADAEMARACRAADLALAGADAVTPGGAVNKVGTHLLALVAREAGIGFYVLAGTSKFVPDDVWVPDRAPMYDRTPLDLLDATITERGATSAAAVRRAVAKIQIPDALLRMVR